MASHDQSQYLGAGSFIPAGHLAAAALHSVEAFNADPDLLPREPVSQPAAPAWRWTVPLQADSDGVSHANETLLAQLARDGLITHDGHLDHDALWIPPGVELADGPGARPSFHPSSASTCNTAVDNPFTEDHATAIETRSSVSWGWPDSVPVGAPPGHPTHHAQGPPAWHPPRPALALGLVPGAPQEPPSGPFPPTPLTETNGTPHARSPPPPLLPLPTPSPQTAQAKPSPRGHGSRRNKAKRTKKLDEPVRLGANQKKKNHTVCLECFRRRVTCVFRKESPRACTACLGPRERKVCLPAHFDWIVGGATLITFHPRQCKIEYLDHTRAKSTTIALPDMHVRHLLDALDACADYDYLRVHRSGGPSYDLDLAQCRAYLKSTRRANRLSFRRFLDQLPLDKTEGWRQCWRRGSGLLLDSHALSGPAMHLSTLPGSFNFSLMSRLDGPDHPGRALTPDDDEDRGIIVAVAQLVLILARKLELAAFDSLQQQARDKKPPTRQQLDDWRRVLLSLRQRIVLWKRAAGRVHAANAASAARDNDALPVALADKLCRILYMHFCSKADETPGKAPETYMTGFLFLPDGYCMDVEEDLPAPRGWGEYDRWMETGVQNFDMWFTLFPDALLYNVS